MSFEYKTFGYKPVSMYGFFSKSDRNGKTLETRLNISAKLGWEFVETIECREGLFQPKEYIILLRRERASNNKTTDALSSEIEPDVIETDQLGSG